jgi:hypothetical protein
MRNNSRRNGEKLWLEWNSTTTQQAQNKANDETDDVKTCQIFEKMFENEE